MYQHLMMLFSTSVLNYFGNHNTVEQRYTEHTMPVDGLVTQINEPGYQINQSLLGEGLIDTLRPRQNGLHFPDDIFK